jgi:hypothetical protein
VGNFEEILGSGRDGNGRLFEEYRGNGRLFEEYRCKRTHPYRRDICELVVCSCCVVLCCVVLYVFKRVESSEELAKRGYMGCATLVCNSVFQYEMTVLWVSRDKGA